ncbi:MAG: ROK family protein [Candidatus Saccharimonadales bacterium]
MYMAIDVGGTKTLMALFGADGQLQNRLKFPTPKEYPDFLSQLRQEWQKLGQPKLLAGAAGLPSVLNRAQGILVSCGNLNWKNQPTKAHLEEIFGCPFVLENDAKAAGLSEAIFVKDEFNKVLYVTLGTGIGYSYIINDIIDLSYPDVGGAGLMVRSAGGQTVAWESLASGTAIVRDYGMPASDITDPKSWFDIAQKLSIGILALLQTASPQVIIFGGGVSVNFDKFATPLGLILDGTSNHIKLQQAHQAEDAVIYGCYHLAHQMEAADGQAA